MRKKLSVFALINNKAPLRGFIVNFICCLSHLSICQDGEERFDNVVALGLVNHYFHRGVGYVAVGFEVAAKVQVGGYACEHCIGTRALEGVGI